MTVREVSPVQFYTFDDPRKLRVYRERLAKAQMDALTGILNSQSWDDFNYRRGQIQGYKTAIELWEQIEKEGRS